ncbi:MAG TPA: CRISPR-associated endonuclease Cas1 [Melioribacteraceae bacterium]|nr:CRISPR-associated endonuclease Cas1 [Melioribacteraceae bacterium]
MQLFIDTFGSFLHVKDQMFEVIVPLQNGEKKKHVIPPSKISNMLLGSGVSLSSDAVKLALTNNIDILFVEYDGMPLGRVWHGKLGSTVKIRRAQLIAGSSVTGVNFVKEWIINKLSNQEEYLISLKNHRSKEKDYLNFQIDTIIGCINNIKEAKANTIDEIADLIRGNEGVAGRIYFETLSELLPEEYKFNGRSKRPALDPFNAFLNYAYGILYGRIEKALIIAGIDPYLGFLHRDDFNQKSMVFDFIEPFRILADKTVYKLFTAKKVSGVHVDKLEKGMSLNKEGKTLLINSFTNVLDEETIKYKNKNYTNFNYIQLKAFEFAGLLINRNVKEEEFEKYDLLGDV